MYKYLVLIFCLMILISCNQNTSGIRFENDYIVVSGMLYGGEYITQENPIFIGKTIDISNGNLLDFYYSDAEVKIIEDSTGKSINLEFFIQNQGNKVLIGYYDPTESFLIDFGKTYNLIAYVNDDSVWASTKIPDDFSILPNEGFTYNPEADFPQMIYDDIDNQYPVQISVKEGIETVLYEEYYCLESWYNAYYIQDMFEEKPETESDYEDSMTGYPRKAISYGRYLPKIVDNEFLIRIPFVKSGFTFYGKHQVTLSLIDNNYFYYLYKTQGYFQGGVNNGIGYFGSASRKKLYTNIIE
ncbi:MAG: hypothetical protein M0Q94_03465 [Candidatus Cloacimonetes bacterium]|nr:hypothetical protein [Candidatus Cloacimonadota bacterium]